MSKAITIYLVAVGLVVSGHALILVEIFSNPASSWLDLLRKLIDLYLPLIPISNIILFFAGTYLSFKFRRDRKSLWRIRIGEYTNFVMILWWMANMTKLDWWEILYWIDQFRSNL